MPAICLCSANHYFMVDGQYRFDPRQLPAAHAACLEKFVSALNGPEKRVTILRGIPGSGKSTYCLKNGDRLDIVVDNTNLSVSEVAPYAALALAYGKELEIVTLRVDPKLAAERNIHGVGEAGVQRMYDRMIESDAHEFWPPWWNHRSEG